MENKASDRRQFPRVHDYLGVSVRHSGEHDAPRYASSIDIAGGGFRLISDVPVKPKSYCWLEFTLPGDESDELIECLAEVRWVRDGGEEAPGKYQFGVKFFDIGGGVTPGFDCRQVGGDIGSVRAAAAELAG